MTELGLVALGAAAGFLGSILGLGGGVVVVPGLTLLFELPLRQAVAASLVAIVATSAGSAAVYLRRGRVHLPLVLRLEVAAVAAAVGAGLMADRVPEGLLYFAFAGVVLYAIRALFRGGPEGPGSAADPGQVRNLGWGMLASGGGGAASALLGIGGGFIKVPIMHVLMGVPLPVVTSTSALMVGMTAAASGWIYWTRGHLLLAVAAPVALGVLVGSRVGSRVSERIPDRLLRVVLAVVFAYIAVRMGWAGIARVAG